MGKYDATINVNGGGTTGQVEAIRLAISRALVEINADYKPMLKAELNDERSKGSWWQKTRTT